MWCLGSTRYGYSRNPRAERSQWEPKQSVSPSSAASSVEMSGAVAQSVYGTAQTQTYHFLKPGVRQSVP